MNALLSGIVETIKSPVRPIELFEVVETAEEREESSANERTGLKRYSVLLVSSSISPSLSLPQSLSSPQYNHPSNIQKRQKKAKDRSMNHHPPSHPLDVSIHVG